jgi:hypothetical protein
VTLGPRWSNHVFLGLFDFFETVGEQGVLGVLVVEVGDLCKRNR